ncbi:lipoprotein LpqH [Mycobacterium sp. LTG2003]
MRAVTVGAAVLLVVALPACDSGPRSDVTVVVDGRTYTVSAMVNCTRFPDGKLLIYAAPSKLDATKRIRVLLGTQHRLVVHAAGFRLPEARGFGDDPAEMFATKVDDSYTISGRIPPEEGQLEWRQFEIDVTCPGYSQPLREQQPHLGRP